MLLYTNLIDINDIYKELYSGDCINWPIIIDNLVIGYFIFLLAIYLKQFKKWGNMSNK